LRLIAGYIRPDAGTIEVAGELMSSPDVVVPPQARGMGMVFQNYAVWPHKTVFQNVVFGLRMRSLKRAEARRKVEEMLALVNLEGLGERYPAELSGGQQQRVALARSLVVEPGILLLDEPLSNLDAKLRERMRGELKELQRRTGITFVYVTHDQAEALALSDQVAVMSGGRLQQYGTPFEVYARPANRMVADFMGLLNLLPGRVREMKSGIASIELTAELVVAVPCSVSLAVGGRVEVAVRPENIRLSPPEGALASAIGKITGYVFLGNLGEYQVVLSWGPLLRVQTHPLQRFAIGDEVAIEIDGAHSSAFPRFSG
jgi:iron(III) transport system ATP-binding protein